MTDEQKAQALAKLQQARESWPDLPAHVYTDAYEEAIISFLDTSAGLTNIEFCVIHILHSETDGRATYFVFNRDGGERRCWER